MADDLSSMYHVQGQVKWFDPTKGFGFVVSDDGGPDILLHVNVLRNFGQSSVADGARIEVVTHRTERGVQAVEVISITPPDRVD
ncbi:MAG: cold-shock protein, partial [Sedimentitalea sp.]